jgi:hypothetical protein
MLEEIKALVKISCYRCNLKLEERKDSFQAFEDKSIFIELHLPLGTNLKDSPGSRERLTAPLMKRVC